MWLALEMSSLRLLIGATIKARLSEKDRDIVECSFLKALRYSESMGGLVAVY